MHIFCLLSSAVQTKIEVKVKPRSAGRLEPPEGTFEREKKISK